YKDACVQLPPGMLPDKSRRVEVLNFNRYNYGIVSRFVDVREKSAVDCRNDPLFTQIPITSAKSKWAAIKKLPTGNINASDKKYEGYIEQLLASLFYPQLDFAQGQSRTDSGVLIRDLVFYNNRKIDFM